MNPTQLTHHTEQVEAFRRDFEIAWWSILMPYIHDLRAGNVTVDELKLAHDVAWCAFKAGKGTP